MNKPLTLLKSQYISIAMFIQKSSIQSHWIFASLAGVCLLFAVCCRAQQPVSGILRLDNGRVVMLLDSLTAAEAISTDKTDAYYNLVTIADMSIQMKRPITADDTRESLLEEYIRFIRSEVADFDDKERQFVAEAMTKLYRTASELTPETFPDTLKLIKTKANHFGLGVWYTRENCIVIPFNELASRKKDNFINTISHEVFHIYSRYHPEKRRELYRMIGFESIGLSNLELPPALARRVLTNPDGVDVAQKISIVTTEGATIHAVPVIYANSEGFQAGQDEFFAYLEFGLFQVNPTGNGKWAVLTKDDGFSSTLKVDGLTDFFRQIRDNTGYIIHPDEILADNFSFILREKNSPAYTAKFSKPGKQLLAEMEKAIKSK